MRARTFKRAAQAWAASKPHAAWEILAVAGLADEWPRFQREALRWARDRYTKEMSRPRR